MSRELENVWPAISWKVYSGPRPDQLSACWKCSLYTEGL